MNAMTPEACDELYRNYVAWLRSLTPATLPERARAALERSDEEFERELFTTFLAEQLENAVAESGEYSSVTEIDMRGRVKQLWYRNPDKGGIGDE